MRKETFGFPMDGTSLRREPAKHMTQMEIREDNSVNIL